ncbi:MAG TPA: NAD(P)/FAD-dependent oxidoreductase [Pseudonocardiaceae bacterium]|jgi:phytoene dehydrogenase-like protein|nr:NAD(P)/FAD-dependent oxidoreductase [Pseudonocardiaceae bacterium]
MPDSPDAIVVGTGPNGLAAAIVLAGAGLRVVAYEALPTVGGGTRTAELTLPGYRHDVCSAVHPMGVASPFFQAFDLAAHGVHMRQPEVAFTHPLDGGRAGLVWPDVERTAAGLGRDGPSWRRLFEPLVRQWRGVVDVAMSDLRRLPAHPLAAVRLAARIAELGTPLWGLRLRGDESRALLAGVAAHAVAVPRAPVPAGVGLLLTTLAHAVGWPIPVGGSQSIADALAAELRRRGGEIVTGQPIESLAELPAARAILLDTAPAGLLRLAGAALPAGYARRLRRFRYGPAVCKVDFALSGPAPWKAEGCDLAGTLHLVGTRAEAVAAERAVAAGRHAERPYVLAVQPGVVDPGRAPAGHHTLDTYAHVPHGSPLDLTEAVTAQIERFAPGFRDLVLATHVVPAAQQASHNANYVGGDIGAGALSVWQTVARPVPRADPYRTPIDGVYLCSASTPPGPGVHGMAGVHAAARALRQRFGITSDPLSLVRGSG